MPDRRPQPEQQRREAERLREIARKAPPIPDPMPPFPTEPPLSAGLAELAGLWLDVRCRCGRTSFPPLRLLAARHGWRTPLGDVLPRLRCSRCRTAPATVDLIADPANGATGNPSGTGLWLRLAPL